MPGPGGGSERETLLSGAWPAWSRFRVLIPVRDRTPPTVISRIDSTRGPSRSQLGPGGNLFGSGGNQYCNGACPSPGRYLAVLSKTPYNHGT
jgi:hypothetical protein